jgi:hypothetical protein
MSSMPPISMTLSPNPSLRNRTFLSLSGPMDLVYSKANTLTSRSKTEIIALDCDFSSETVTKIRFFLFLTPIENPVMGTADYTYMLE